MDFSVLDAKEPQAEGIATFQRRTGLRSQLASSKAGLTPKGGTLPRLALHSLSQGLNSLGRECFLDAQES